VILACFLADIVPLLAIGLSSVQLPFLEFKEEEEGLSRLCICLGGCPRLQYLYCDSLCLKEIHACALNMELPECFVLPPLSYLLSSSLSLETSLPSLDLVEWLLEEKDPMWRLEENQDGDWTLTLLLMVVALCWGDWKCKGVGVKTVEEAPAASLLFLWEWKKPDKWEGLTS
jgi:hypothetical protein